MKGMPVITNDNSAREILEVDLSLENQKRLDESCNIIKEHMEQIRKVIF